ncbi:hypothetical protein Syun_006202 [Stephania yunnanensis]|uniref:Uncharacterized protein n=1 Tax=Stephania yunnanensis TaxID=152371 RepID=A0AAP0KW86_9MAGN
MDNTKMIEIQRQQVPDPEVSAASEEFWGFPCLDNDRVGGDTRVEEDTCSLSGESFESLDFVEVQEGAGVDDVKEKRVLDYIAPLEIQPPLRDIMTDVVHGIDILMQERAELGLFLLGFTAKKGSTR